MPHSSLSFSDEAPVLHVDLEAAIPPRLRRIKQRGPSWRQAVATAAGVSLNDAVKLNIYLTDLANFAKVNETMAKYFSEPFPARAAVGVKELPRGALVEADAVLVLG